MADLITVEQLGARLGTDFTGDRQTQAQALISDASALVCHVAKTDFAGNVPAVVMAVVAQMVRRALENPGELTAENIGGYGWQSQHSSAPSGGSIYITRAERRLIRESAGRPSVITISMDTGLGDPLAATE